MGAVTKKTGRPLPDFLRSLEERRPVESLDETDFAKNWRLRSFCASSEEPNNFFKKEEFGVCKVACDVVCPVKEQCLIWGLMYNEEGLWGGTTEEERGEFRKKNVGYVESLILRAKTLGKYFPVGDASELLARFNNRFAA